MAGDRWQSLSYGLDALTNPPVTFQGTIAFRQQMRLNDDQLREAVKCTLGP